MLQCWMLTKTEDLDEATRLLVKCEEELEEHDSEYQHKTSKHLMDEIRAFLKRHSLATT